MLSHQQLFRQLGLTHLRQKTTGAKVVQQPFIQAKLTAAYQRPNGGIDSVAIDVIVILSGAAQPQQRIRLAGNTCHHFTGHLGSRPKIRHLARLSCRECLLERFLSIRQQTAGSLYFSLERGGGLVSDWLTNTQRSQLQLLPTVSTAGGRLTEGFSGLFAQGDRIPALRHIHHHPLAVGNQRPNVILGTDVEALNGERCLMPRPIQIRHKHADLKIMNRDFFLLDAHRTPQKTGLLDTNQFATLVKRHHYSLVSKHHGKETKRNSSYQTATKCSTVNTVTGRMHTR